MDAGEREDTLCDLLGTLFARAEAVCEAVTFDDSGTHGQGGNGGLLSRETIRKVDGLRLAMSEVRRRCAELGEGRAPAP